MGLALADLIGLTCASRHHGALRDEMGEGKYRLAPLLRKMVRAGRLGRKAVKGFRYVTVGNISLARAQHRAKLWRAGTSCRQSHYA